MKTIYTDHQIKIRVTDNTPGIDRKYLENFLNAKIIPIKNTIGDLIGIDVQRA